MCSKIKFDIDMTVGRHSEAKSITYNNNKTMHWHLLSIVLLKSSRLLLYFSKNQSLQLLLDH